ncbi:glycosyltransferase family 1 protein [Leeuwenhoekiella aequorea]|uniref:Glycosyltransferase involved in cell wall biosynthesis n=1 Tax=Leeuwenhoekiella aequorea TaxID=283736 RepID=A0A4Q0PDK2_9FLAO|nr:glycosyltransferase family 1 protein [Leeuwenhoekiella aequorea]RXG24907.1 hypothetical protein DSM00_703 [Leeuwenhoekiella aequorea]
MALNVLILAETIDVDTSSAGKANLALIASLVDESIAVRVFHYSHKEVLISGAETILIQENKKDFYYWLSRSQRILQRITKINFSKLLEARFGFSLTFKNDVNSMVVALNKEAPAAYDFILTLSKGSSYRTHAALLKLPQWHSKWLAYIHDPYPFNWYPEPYNWKEAGSIQKELFFKIVAQTAMWLGYPSEHLRVWMGQFDLNFKEKGVLLPHQITHRISKKTLPAFFNSNDFNVLHAGNLLEQRNPFYLIKAWTVFLEARPNARNCSQLLLIGPGNFHEPKLSELCITEETIYRYSGFMDYDVVLELERQSSVNIVLEAEADISPFLPAKFPNLIMTNRPLLHLGPKKSEVRRLLGFDYSYVAEVQDIQAIANQLILLFDSWIAGELHIQSYSADLKYYLSSAYLKETLNHLITKH